MGRYARLESKLGEIARARGILVYASRFANPRHEKRFWEEWNQFEVQYGNEDTFRDMLRIKRSIGASFSTLHASGLHSVSEPKEHSSKSTDPCVKRYND